jgi:hypothetical protein
MQVSTIKANDSKSPCYLYRYENVSDYYKACLATDQRDGRANQSRSGSFSFTRSKSFEETQKRYTHGFSEGTKLAKALRMQITPFIRTTSSHKNGWQPQRYAGGNFILSNYVRGLPEVCNVMTSVKSKKFASIILNGSASCGVDTEIMLKRGVAVIALADILELNGYRTAIRVVYNNRGSGGMEVGTDITVKRFSQPPELDRLAFYLADPSALRRLFFSWLENLPASFRESLSVPGHYGIPCELPKSEVGKQDIYIGCMHWDLPAWHSIDGAVAWIKETLKRYGIVCR